MIENCMSKKQTVLCSGLIQISIKPSIAVVLRPNNFLCRLPPPYRTVAGVKLEPIRQSRL